MLTVNPQTHEIRLHRNTDSRHKWTIRDVAGVALDVSSAAFKFTVRDFYDGTIIFQLASPAVNGIDMTNAAGGVVIVKIPRSISGSMAGTYIYDLQMTLGGDVELPAGAGRLIVLKDVTGTGAAPVVVPPLQFLTYLVLPFEGQLQNGDILTQDLDIARTGNITIRHAHIDADAGPTVGSAIIAIQDHPSAPTQIVNLIVPANGALPVHQAFDADETVPTLTPFTLTSLSGKKLTVKVTAGNFIERGKVFLGYIYA